MPSANAVASGSTLNPFPRAEWIFSTQPSPFPSSSSLAFDSDITPTESVDTATKKNSVQYEITDTGWNYGPTIKRKNLKFVRSTGLDSSGERKGEGKHIIESERIGQRKENEKRGLYDGVTTSASLAVASRLAQTKGGNDYSRSTGWRVKSVKKAHPVSTKEIDLTLSSDDDGYMNNASSSSSETEEEEEDDDIIVLDPHTSLPLPLLASTFQKKTHNQPYKSNSRSIVDLLPPSASTPIIPIIPPIQYGIESSNIGYKLLSRSGWKEGDSLGVKKEDIEHDDRLRVPLKNSNKMDKRGLGMATIKKDKVKKKGKRERKVERLNRHKDVEERKHRKEMLRYMNS